jgi:hypothetical protein
VLARAGYRRIKRETVTHEWIFDSEGHLYAWMTKFFGIRVSKPVLIRRVGEILGMKRATDTLRINWKLDFVTAQA